MPDVYRVRGPVDIRPLAALVDLPALEDLRDPPLKPQPSLDVAGPDLFALLDERDVVLHQPYDSFDPVVAFVSRAADDPDVLAIKQTLYRTSGDSPIVRALARAAENGKQVTVLVELLARFDEQSNIRWARRLEESGCHVIYGIRGYKTHAKIALVVRRGRSGIRRYVHLGTGNYNEKTARLYTDFGLMTSDREIGEDASAFFNALTGYSDPPRMKKLVMAPTHLRERILRLIQRERERAESGVAASIRAKMNSLVDEDIIRALYDAARAGREDPAQRARHLLPAPGAQGHERRHRGGVDRRPLPRALAHLPLQQRRRRGGLPLERRLDAAEPRPPDRAAVPGARARGAAEGPDRARRGLRRQRQGAPAAARRQLQAPQARARRGAVPLAARAAPRGEAGRRARASGGGREPRAAALAGRVSGPGLERALAPLEQAQLERGVAQFNERHFYECHDTLEELWSGLRGGARDLVQGLIQVAVGFYHLGNGNRTGAVRLFDRGLERLARHPDAYARLDLASLREAVARWREAAAGDGPLPEAGPPAIRRLP